MKTINEKQIRRLKPCDNMLQNYLSFYAGKKFRITQFMGLKHISRNDKVWVAFRMMKPGFIKLSAADIAESVLHIYEKEFPNDDRPRKAIEAARGRDSNTTQSAYAAAAADAAANAAVYAAVYSDKKSVQEKLIRKILLKYWRMS